MSTFPKISQPHQDKVFTEEELIYTKAYLLLKFLENIYFQIWNIIAIL